MPPASCADKHLFSSKCHTCYLLALATVIPSLGDQEKLPAGPPALALCLPTAHDQRMILNTAVRVSSQKGEEKKNLLPRLKAIDWPLLSLSPCPPLLCLFPPIFTGSLATSPASSEHWQPPDLHIRIFACCLYSPTSMFALWGQKLCFWFVCFSTTVSSVPRTEPGTCRR